MPHITDRDTRQFSNSCPLTTGKAAKPEDFSQLILLLVKLRKSAKAKIFSRNLRDNQVSTLPQELFERGKMYYSKEQKEKDKTPAPHRFRTGAQSPLPYCHQFSPHHRR